MKQLIYLFAVVMVFSACSSNVDANKKMAGDFLDLALSANPLDAQELTHPNFKFVFMGNTEISKCLEIRSTQYRRNAKTYRRLVRYNSTSRHRGC